VDWPQSPTVKGSSDSAAGSAQRAKKRGRKALATSDAKAVDGEAPAEELGELESLLAE
jgi:hypothetical protein